MAKEIYNYYPSGDKDQQSRQTRVDLVYEDGEWKMPGQGPVKPEILVQMRENIIRGWAQIIKKNKAGQIMPGEGESDFLDTVPEPPKKYRGKR